MTRETGLSVILKETLDNGEISVEEARYLVDEYGYVFVGRGDESLVIYPKLRRSWWQVFSPPQEPATVLAIEAFGSHYSESSAMCLFYSQKIMSTLFPHNFPRFLKSWSGYEVFIDDQVKRLSGTERTYVNIVEFNKQSGWDALDLNAKYPFQAVANAIAQIRLPFYIDVTSGNFGLAKDGGVYYLDRIVMSFLPLGDQVKSNIDKFMQSGDYSLGEKQTVQISVNRLNANLAKR